MYIIYHANIQILCTHNKHYDEWGIRRKVFEQVFNIAHQNFVKTHCMIKITSLNKINEKRISQ